MENIIISLIFAATLAAASGNHQETTCEYWEVAGAAGAVAYECNWKLVDGNNEETLYSAYGMLVPGRQLQALTDFVAGKIEVY